MKGTFKQLQLALGNLGEGFVGPNRLKYDCPQCKASGMGYGKKNLEIDWTKGAYHCWSCNMSGGLYKLVNVYGYREYAVWFKKDEELQQEIAINILELPKTISAAQHANALEYLTRRKISLNQIKQFNIRYCYEGQYNKHIIFPSYNSLNQLTYFVAHDFVNKKYKERKGNNHICFFENMIDKKLPIVLTEGVYDALSVPNSIPLLGLKITNELLDFIANQKIIIAIDDEVFTSTSATIIKQLSKVTQNITIFKSCPFKDLNDFYMRDETLLKQKIYDYYQTT